MRTVEDATRAVLESTGVLPVERCLVSEALGLVLAEDVRADRDSPPFDKSLMDGYAVRSVDFSSVSKGDAWKVIERVPAGSVPSRAVAVREASLIMTGAPLPAGADCVIQRELARPDGGERVAFELASPPRPGMSVFRKAAEMKEGDLVLERGWELNAPRLALAAGVGRTEVLVHPRPRVSVLSTGDELVPPGVEPAQGRSARPIRRCSALWLEGREQRFASGRSPWTRTLTSNRRWQRHWRAPMCCWYRAGSPRATSIWRPRHLQTWGSRACSIK